MALAPTAAAASAAAASTAGASTAGGSASGRPTLALTDPIYVPPAQPNALDRRLLTLIKDPRDLPFVHFMVQFAALVLPLAVALFVSFSGWLALVYLVVVFAGFIDRYILMLHCTSHRKLFHPKYKVLNAAVVWVLGPFFGETPETYFAHHVGMHHPENNLPDDLSSTMHHQRDRLGHFGRYLGRFWSRGIVDLARYHRQRGRHKLQRRAIVGELSFLAAVAALLWLNPAAALVVFVVPFVFTRSAMMAGNWGQHAFIDAADPGNSYRNSITCINARYNRRCFNDGYHIGHHLRATRHWTELPVEFADHLVRYRDEDAIVFQGIDFFGVWLLLMRGRYDLLAERFVDLRAFELPGDTAPADSDLRRPRSREAIIALLRTRTRAIAPAPAAPVPLRTAQAAPRAVDSARSVG